MRVTRSRTKAAAGAGNGDAPSLPTPAKTYPGRAVARPGVHKVRTTNQPVRCLRETPGRSEELS
jgi:hypothetical protein